MYPEIAKLFREQLSTNTSYSSTQDEHFSNETFHVVVTRSQLRISCCLLQSPKKQIFYGYFKYLAIKCYVLGFIPVFVELINEQ